MEAEIGVILSQAKGYLEPPEAGRSKEGSSPRGRRGSTAPARPSFISDFWPSNSEILNLCCSKSPSLRKFAIVALGNSYRVYKWFGMSQGSTVLWWSSSALLSSVVPLVSGRFSPGGEKTACRLSAPGRQSSWPGWGPASRLEPIPAVGVEGVMIDRSSLGSAPSGQGERNIVIYNNYIIIFGLCPWFGHRASKTSGISEESDQGVFCYVNEVTLGPHLRMGAGGQEDQQLRG